MYVSVSNRIYYYCQYFYTKEHISGSKNDILLKCVRVWYQEKRKYEKWKFFSRLHNVYISTQDLNHVKNKIKRQQLIDKLVNFPVGVFGILSNYYKLS